VIVPKRRERTGAIHEQAYFGRVRVHDEARRVRRDLNAGGLQGGYHRRVFRGGREPLAPSEQK
jgi:hypothetical protein